MLDFIAYEFNNNGAAYGGPGDHSTYHLLEMIGTTEAIMQMRSHSYHAELSN